MKKVLFIAYQFPPMGGSGVQRSSKFVKYLRGYGWEPVVLTRSVGNMQLRDDSMLSDIPEDTRIIRTRAFDLTELPGMLKYLGKFIARKLLIPDGERLWQIFAMKRALKYVNKGRINIIYTTSYPYSSHILGLKLHKKITGKYPHIKWVADFRDEWTNNPYLLDKPHYKRRMKIERRMEKEIIDTADMVIANTPVMLENFVRADERLRSKFTVIPNGFDADDFRPHSPIGRAAAADGGNTVSGKTAGSDAAEVGKGDRFTIVYTGAFYGRRKPDPFFAALKYAIDAGQIEEDKIIVKLIGNFKEGSLKEKIQSFGLEDTVTIMPYMAHNACLAEVRSSDALLLIEGNGPGAEAFHTGKLFEYMNSGKPIIAVIPQKGAAAMLIRETSTGLVSDPADIKSTAAIITIFYRAWTEGTIGTMYKPNIDEISKYERKKLTGRLAEVFDLSCN